MNSAFSRDQSVHICFEISTLLLATRLQCLLPSLPPRPVYESSSWTSKELCETSRNPWWMDACSTRRGILRDHPRRPTTTTSLARLIGADSVISEARPSPLDAAVSTLRGGLFSIPALLPTASSDVRIPAASRRPTPAWNGNVSIWGNFTRCCSVSLWVIQWSEGRAVLSV